MNKALGAAVIGGAFLLGGLASAQAATLTASELLAQFNLITTGDVTGINGHIHGRALVGGNMSGVSEVYTKSNRVLDQYDIVPSDFAALTVGGNVGAPNSEHPEWGTDVYVQNGGNAAITGDSPNLRFNGDGSYVPYAAPENYGQILSDYATSLGGMETSMAGVTVNNAWDDSGVLGYSVSGVSNAVISMNEADFAQGDFRFDIGSEVDWVLVNVFSTDLDKIFNIGNTTQVQQAGGPDAQKLIFNFVDFEEVEFSSRWSVGAILADGALVKSTGGDTAASIFASEFYITDQLHYNGQGQMPDIVPPAPVPLPAGAPLLLLGLGGLALLHRRKPA